MNDLRPLRIVLALMALLAMAGANAQGGLTFGAGLNPLDMVANANVTVPLFTTGEAEHAARGDVSYAFGGLPAFSATYLLRDAEPERTSTYLGAGAGVTFLSAPTVRPLLSLHALAGGIVPVAGGLGAYGEVVVSGSSLATSLRFALGVSYTFGGR